MTTNEHDKSSFPILEKPLWKWSLHFLGILVGFILGTFVIFQAFFLAKVIPHGGL